MYRRIVDRRVEAARGQRQVVECRYFGGMEEQEIAGAASLWPAAHNARWEALHGDPPKSGDAVRAQAAERLRRANA